MDWRTNSADDFKMDRTTGPHSSYRSSWSNWWIAGRQRWRASCTSLAQPIFATDRFGGGRGWQWLSLDPVVMCPSSSSSSSSSSMLNQPQLPMAWSGTGAPGLSLGALARAVQWGKAGSLHCTWNILKPKGKESEMSWGILGLSLFVADRPVLHDLVKSLYDTFLQLAPLVGKPSQGPWRARQSTDVGWQLDGLWYVWCCGTTASRVKGGCWFNELVWSSECCMIKNYYVSLIYIILL